MDGTMRDLERIRERGESDEAGRKLALVGLAGLAVLAVILALCMQVGGEASADAVDADPLARLDPAFGLAIAAPCADEEAPAAADVDRIALSFPETLAGSDRPELAAALAAASAELRHPDPLPTLGAPIVPVVAADLAERVPAALPAALAAGASSVLARTAAHDPMLLAALPDTRVGDHAPEGHDGEFTVQVISYDSADGAHAFAAGLRARGHRAFVLRAEIDGRGTVYRVRIGPFETMAEAQRYRHGFEETERMNTIVVRRRDA